MLNAETSPRTLRWLTVVREELIVAREADWFVVHKKKQINSSDKIMKEALLLQEKVKMIE